MNACRSGNFPSREISEEVITSSGIVKILRLFKCSTLADNNFCTEFVSAGCSGPRLNVVGCKSSSVRRPENKLKWGKIDPMPHERSNGIVMCWTDGDLNLFRLCMAVAASRYLFCWNS